MMRPKKAARGKQVELDDDAIVEPELAASGSHVVRLDTTNPFQLAGRGVSAIVKAIMALIAIILVLYLSLAATLMVLAPGPTGVTWMMRGTFVGGIPERGDFVYASATTPVEPNAISKIQQAFVGVPDDMVAEVIAGPFVDVSNGEEAEEEPEEESEDVELTEEAEETPEDAGDTTSALPAILVDGEDSGYVGEIESFSLSNEYLVVCIDGSCGEHGELVILPHTNVAGEARGMVSLEGLGAFESVKE